MLLNLALCPIVLADPMLFWRHLAPVGALLFSMCVPTMAVIAHSAQVSDIVPARMDCQSVAITAPLPNSVLSGTIEIRGRALIPDFRFYKVEYSAQIREQWVLIGTDVIHSPVQDGLLVAWPTTIVPDGTYRLRLHVVNSTGNFCEIVLGPYHIANSRPNVTATPEPTETPIRVAVPSVPTATLAVSLPIEFSPQKETPSALPARGSGTAGPITDLYVLGGFFIFGASLAAAVTLLVGLLFFVGKRR